MITNHPIPQKPPVPLLVKVSEVARILSVSRCTVYHLIDSGDLIASEINPSKKKKRRHRRVTRDSLLKFYRRRFGHTLQRALDNPFEPSKS